MTAVATTREEIAFTGGGALTSATGLQAEVAIVVDVTHATDYPGAEKRKHGDYRLGGGPVLTRGASINPVVFDLLVAAAEEEKIPYAIEAAPRETSTDADAIFTAQSRRGDGARLRPQPLHAQSRTRWCRWRTWSGPPACWRRSPAGWRRGRTWCRGRKSRAARTDSGARRVPGGDSRASDRRPTECAPGGDSGGGERGMSESRCGAPPRASGRRKTSYGCQQLPEIRERLPDGALDLCVVIIEQGLEQIRRRRTGGMERLHGGQPIGGLLALQQPPARLGGLGQRLQRLG